MWRYEQPFVLFIAVIRLSIDLSKLSSELKMFSLQPTLYQENTGGREEVGVENDKDETAGTAGNDGTG